MLLLPATAVANWARCTFGGSSIQTRSSWTAGTDPVNLWFGQGWSGSAGYAELTPPGATQTRVLMQAMVMPPSGTYSFSVQARNSSPGTQSMYWHILAVTNGTTLQLGDGGVPMTIVQSGVKSLYRGSMPTGAASNTWLTYTNNVAISAADAAAYQYVVVALVGSAPTGGTVRYDNILSSAPVSSTASEGLTCTWVNIPSSLRSVSAISWSSPLRTSTEGEVYWVDTAVRFYPGGPQNNFAMRLQGTITLPSGGNWIFTLGSDDGSRLTINGTVVVLHDGPHGFSNKTGTITLAAGTYPIEVVFFENGGNHGLQLLWRSPTDTASSIVPYTAFISGSSGPRLLQWTDAEPASR